MAYGVIDIVTGSTQGIGRAIAESIASHRVQQPPHNYSLVLVGRNIQRGAKAARDIHHATGLNVIAEACDLRDYQEVQQLKGRIAKQMHEDFRVGILVNNAAECPIRQELVTRPQTDGSSITETPVDSQFASNVLGYHFMLKSFQDKFLLPGDGNTQQTHIVNVASNWAGDLDLNDLHFQRRHYDNDAAYCQSKQCDRMLSTVWAKRLGKQAVVNACHPGDPCTTLSKALGYNIWSSPPSANLIEKETPIPFLCGLKGEVNATGLVSRNKQDARPLLV
jgi:retinol dehydrogenase-12